MLNWQMLQITSFVAHALTIATELVTLLWCCVICTYAWRPSAAAQVTPRHGRPPNVWQQRHDEAGQRAGDKLQNMQDSDGDKERACSMWHHVALDYNLP